MNLSKLLYLTGAYGLIACYAKSKAWMGMLDSDLISYILEEAGNFTDSEEERICERMVSELTREEQEIAARTSHAYWLASLNGKRISTDTRMRAAKREARRHLVAENGNFDDAMTRLRDTCHFRKEKKLDLLRLCFVENISDFIENVEDHQLLLHWESQLQKEMARQATWVTPNDNENNQQAILHRSSRNTAEVDEDAYHLLTFFTTERALALSELLSKGQTETCILVLYFENYHSDNIPPLSVVRTSVTDLQMLYPERIQRILVLDPPRWLRITYGMVSMFLSKETRNKVHMVSGKDVQMEEPGIYSGNQQIREEMMQIDFLLDYESILSIATRSNPRELLVIGNDGVSCKKLL